MEDDDAVFKALADPTRRLLLDTLLDQPGASLTELEAAVTARGNAMTRFGVMKHLKVLTEAGLVVARRDGRRTLHHLNPVPIQIVHDRWITRFTEGPAQVLADLKHTLEDQP